MLDLSFTIMSKFQKIRIFFTWVSANDWPADYNSKIHTDIIEKINSSFWHEGPKLFLCEDSLQKKSYLKFNAETRSLMPLKKLPQHEQNPVTPKVTPQKDKVGSISVVEIRREHQTQEGSKYSRLNQNQVWTGGKMIRTHQVKLKIICRSKL